MGPLCARCQLLKYDSKKLVKDDRTPLDDADEQYYMMPLNYEVEDDFPRLTQLAASARKCPLCKFIRNLIWNLCMSDPKLPDPLEVGRMISNDADVAMEKIRLGLVEWHSLSSKFLRDGVAPGPASITGSIRLGKITRDVRIEAQDVANKSDALPSGLGPLTKAAQKQIQGWIDACLDRSPGQHVYCPKAKENDAPLRILDVMDGDNVRLVSTQGSKARYAILSYCWGSSSAIQSARTLQSNLSSRLSGFSLSDLPKTLKDSVILTRRLGIPYIWIDAICIVQDGPEWGSEAGRMMQYYENAYLSIIPVLSASSEDSFLRSRPIWVSQRVDEACSAQPGRAIRFTYPIPKGVSDEISRSRWNSRAWTFQEHVLSARNLFLGTHEMQFECRTITCSDVGHHWYEEGFSLVAASNAPLRSPEWGSMDRILSLWYQLVTEYVPRQLTFESDKLAAISGVAQKVGQLMRVIGSEDEYVSGFWKIDLWNGLYWKVRGFGPPRSKHNPWPPKSHNFPSWSWCSMNRPLAWNDRTGNIPCAQLVQLIRPISHDKYGLRTECTKIILTSWVFPMKLLDTEFPLGLEARIRLDDGSDDVMLSNDHQLSALTLSAYLDGGAEDEWIASPANYGAHQITGLILESADGNHDGAPQYRRVGAFEIVCDTDIDRIVNFGSTSAPAFYREVYTSRSTLALV